MKHKRMALKTIGILTSLAGFAVSFVSDWVEEEKMEEKVQECVKKAFAEQNIAVKP